MEARGLPLNVAQWRRVLAEAEAKAADARTRLGASVGTDLTGNPSLEPGERGRILAWFQAEGYPIQSTSKHALAAVDHPAAQALLDWREAAKLTSTYEGYLDRLAGGRIFGRFHALGAASGRMSCGHPNLQNIPARLRPCVEAPEGRVPVSAITGMSCVLSLPCLETKPSSKPSWRRTSFRRRSAWSGSRCQRPRIRS